MNLSISATNDGGVIVAQVYGSSVSIYHSPPVELDLSGAGVSSIGGVGGSYFQSELTYNCEGNFNCSEDQDVDGSDAALFKVDFGRNLITDPCTALNPCKYIEVE